jgi:hypothetical protein
MRLVSPAPVLVPGAGPRPQAPPTIYQPPQPQGTQQTIYSQQNNNNVGGKRLSPPHPKHPQLSHFTHTLTQGSLSTNKLHSLSFFRHKNSMFFIVLNNWTSFGHIFCSPQVHLITNLSCKYPKTDNNPNLILYNDCIVGGFQNLSAGFNSLNSPCPSGT